MSPPGDEGIKVDSDHFKLPKASQRPETKPLAPRSEVFLLLTFNYTTWVDGLGWGALRSRSTDCEFQTWLKMQSTGHRESITHVLSAATERFISKYLEE